MPRSASLRLRLTIAALLACAPARPAALGAQTTAEYARRVDRLLQLVRTQNEDAARARALASSQRPLPHDTVRVGSLVVVTDSSHDALARASAADAWSDVQRTFGTRAADIAATPFILRNRLDSATQRGTLRIVVVGTLDSSGLVHDERTAFAERRDLAAQWRVRASAALSRALPSELLHWLGGDLHVDSLAPARWAAARTQLVTAASRAARECFAGAVIRCSEILGLVPVEDPVMDLYDPAERADIVRHTQFATGTSSTAVAYDQCINRGDRGACDSLAHLIPPDRVPMPAGADMRQLLARFALELGGPGAVDRAAATPGTVARQLSAAARIAPDSLVARWRDRVVRASTGSTALNGSTVLASLFWASLCGALALRSSRWR